MGEGELQPAQTGKMMATPVSTTTREEAGASPEAAAAASAEPVHSSPWTVRQRIARQAWFIVQGTLFRFSLYNAFRWRRFLLGLFGARLGANVRLRPTVRVDVPWNLTIGDNSSVGDYAILYCLGPVTLGKHVTISQYAHLCAGTHETNTRRMLLLKPPIAIGDDAWIAADAFVGPGVTIGAGTLVGARSNVFGDLPAGVVAVGSPARAIRAREFVKNEENLPVPELAR
jgi:putative colanic acid biosynthesis acetyltransferase WcaF